MRILITGASSFIGQELTQKLVELGHEIIGTYNTKKLDSQLYLKQYQWNMNNQFRDSWLDQVDCVVHLAWMLDKNTIVGNLNSSLDLYKKTISKNIKFIFISSCSAHKHAISEYGISKYKFENMMDHNKVIILRPGWVIGKKSSFARAFKLLHKLFVFPIIGDGNQQIPLIGVDDLVTLLGEICTQAVKKNEFNLFYKPTVSYSELLKIYCKVFNLKRFYIHVPFVLLLNTVKFLQFIKLPTPVTIEQLNGYKMNQNLYFNSDIEMFNIKNDLSATIERNMK